MTFTKLGHLHCKYIRIIVKPPKNYSENPLEITIYIHRKTDDTTSKTDDTENTQELP